MEDNIKNTDISTNLTVFEEISRDISIKNQEVKIPMAMVFGRGSTSNLPSFGNDTLAENSKKVDLALANVGELQDIWNHSHTQWMWRHLNLSWHAPLKNMRQISAEISKKKAALTEAKWRQVEAELKIKKIESELEKGQLEGGLDYFKEIELKIKLAKLREGMAEGITMIEGAMKDVLALNDLYEQLKQRVSNFSEADIEKEETKSHLKRALVQSIRDVRMSGVITKAEQEYLEQIGVNPMKVQNLMRAYVENEAKADSWDVSELYKFVDSLTDQLVDSYKVDQVRMNLQGFHWESNPEFTQVEKLALLEGSNTKSTQD